MPRYAAVNSKTCDDSPLQHKPVHHQGERQQSSPHTPTPTEAASHLFTSSRFICEEARMRNDPSFIDATSSITPLKGERFSMKTPRTPIMVHRTEVDSTKQKDEASGLDIPKKQCPIHKKPHPLQKCGAFREKPLEEQKAFLRENSICFRCCSATSYQAKNCKAVIQC